MPKLRGHHLICLHFFNGEGYNDEFIEKLKDIINRAEGEDITITSKADDVCNVCPWLNNDRCGRNETSDKEIKDMDAKALELLGLSVGETKGWENLRDRVAGLFSDWYNLYCMECDWNGACERNDFYASLEEEL